MSYYHRFLELFPDVVALASAPEDLVLKCWQGLGYYSRARNLLAAARRIVEMHGGVFPTDYADVRALPGVGDYTGCGDLFDRLRRTLCRTRRQCLSGAFPPLRPRYAHRYDFRKADVRCVGRFADRPAAAGTLQPGHYGFRGSLLSSGTAPLYGVPFARPLSGFCRRTVDVRPVKQGRTAVEPRYFNYLHVECGDELVLRRRGAGDIWQGLYEFPLIETPEPVEYTVLAAMPEFCALFKDTGTVCLVGTVTMPVHQLSHRAIHAVFYRIVVERWTPSLREMLVIPREILGDYAVSRLTERYLSR